MSFLTLADYKSQISDRDMEALTELNEPTPQPEQLPEDDPEEDPEADPTPAPAPALSIREEAEQAAMTEVASYLRGRFDMEAAYAAEGAARNRQLVMMVVDVAIWHLCPRVAFANVSEVREVRYKAALAWLKMAERGQSNPDLPRYAADPEKPQGRRLFRYGSNPVRSQSF
jgi:phage gp36-like protein